MLLERVQGDVVPILYAVADGRLADHTVSLRNDAVHALRVFTRNPGFAAVTVIVLAVGIGAAASIFTVFSSLMLRPLPLPHPEQSVRVRARQILGANANAVIGARYDVYNPNSDANQQQPLRPGAARGRLADALGVDEMPAGDIAIPTSE